MTPKKKILVFVDWFKPGYKAGGPIQSVYNLVSRLSAEFDFYVYTSNTDLSEREPYHNVKFDEWTKFEGINVFYASKKNQGFLKTKSIIKKLNPEVVYVNSLFSVNYAVIPMFLHKLGLIKKIVLAPRGMLGSGALGIKAKKKKFFLQVFKKMQIFKNVVWHATTYLEAQEIKKEISEFSNIVIAENFPNTICNEYIPKQKKEGSLKLFFFSRISEKKNLIGALSFLKLCKNQIQFNIYGGIEDAEYWRKCELIIKELPNNIQVFYKGTIHPSKIKETFKSYHAFILPTFNENFGHAIIEAMNCGAIPILSDQTPWRDLENKKIGFDIELTNKKEFTDAIDMIAEMGQIDFDEWSENAYHYSLKIIDNKQTIVDTIKLFNL